MIFDPKVLKTGIYFLVFRLFTNIIANKIQKLWQSHKMPEKKQKRNPQKHLRKSARKSAKKSPAKIKFFAVRPPWQDAGEVFHFPPINPTP